LIKEARKHYQAGRKEQAERMYRSIFLADLHLEAIAAYRVA
jgi:hypothetical protein